MKSLLNKILVAGIVLVQAGVAFAEYPDRPVKVIVPFAAGGPADLIARHVFNKLSTNMGQSFVVENRAGAGGNIGAQVVARAPADGYTLLMIVPAHAVNMTLYTNPGYDARNDFALVAPLARSPLVLLATSKQQWADVRALLSALRASPAAVPYGSSGVGTPPHLAMEMLKRATGSGLLHVPYRGGALALNDLMGGQITLMFDAMVTGMKAAQAGKVNALAVSGSSRSAIAPTIPTLAESGLPGFDVYTWYGIAAPARTAPEIVRKLNLEINKVLADDDIRNQLLQWGAEPMKMSETQFTEYFARDVTMWGEAVRVSGARAE